MSYDYQFEVMYNNQTPKKSLKDFESNFGPRVIERDSQGIAENFCL